VEQIVKEQKLTIIADDLTGAMDSSGYFAVRGFSTVVILGRNPSPIEEVVVISTDSRGDSPSKASKKLRQVTAELKEGIVYKKIDSTLRGNIGSELAAAMEGLGSDRVIVAPAFPAVGRTTINGLLLVNGTPVSETQLAHDPISPVTESHIARLLEQSIGHKVGMVSLDSINAGPESVYQAIASREERILVCDATKQSHLHNIACASALAGRHWLLCGSAGLARELTIFLGKKSVSTAGKKSANFSGPALLAVSSRHQVSAIQLNRAHNELGIPLLELKIGAPANSRRNTTELERIILEASALLRQEKTVAITSTFSRYMPALKRLMAGILAELVADILCRQDIAGLFLCGGDTASEVCRRLDLESIYVKGEIEPGVPAGYFVDNHGRHIRVVTKAGGFGREDAIIKSISYLERGDFS
jgi:D-threonate/D-erythronate kinase